jgi:hypothetical protein
LIPATGAIVVASDNGTLPTSQYQPEVVSQLSKNGVWRSPLLSDKGAGFSPRSLIDQHFRYFGPRFGSTNQIGASGKTLLRGGYGIFYPPYPYRYLLQTTDINPPFAGMYNFTQAITKGIPTITLQVPYSSSGNASLVPSGLQKDFTLPDNQQWNVTIERELAQNTVVSLGYVGNKGTHLFRSVNPNGPYYDPATKQVLRPYSSTYGVASLNERVTDGNSIYNAMQAEVRRRIQKGFLFNASWTWAKGLDDVGTTVNANGLDVENLGRDRANSDYVLRHTVKFNGVYDLPFGRGRAFLNSAPRWLDGVIGGWRLAGLWTYTTGRRFTPTFNTVGVLGNNRPDVVYGVQANLPVAQRVPDHWFNAAAFATVPSVDPITGAPRYGDAGRNILVGPGTDFANTSLSKEFRLFCEGSRIQARAELFNTFNHPNYDFPVSNISSANTVGVVNNIIKPMRQAQFIVRFDFQGRP